jgi:hypothetical protein
MAYEDKDPQGITKDGKKLPTRKELNMDEPSKVGFWKKEDATASGHDELAENFSNPHGGKSRGTKSE